MADCGGFAGAVERYRSPSSARRQRSPVELAKGPERGVEAPVGKVIRVNNLPCKVVATLQPKGLSLSGQDQDDTIILPFTTAQKKIKGITWLDDILCSAVSPDVVKMAGQEATAVLRDRHHLRPEEEDDFNIRHPEEIVKAQMESSETFSTLDLPVGVSCEGQSSHL